MLPVSLTPRGPHALCMFTTLWLIVYLCYAKAPRPLQWASGLVYAASWLFYFLDPQEMTVFTVIQAVLGLYLVGHIVYSFWGE
jgi:hypothetical protein